MFERLKSNVLYGSIAGVEIIGDANSSCRFNVVKAENRRSNLHIRESRSFSSINDIFGFLDKNTPLVININGRQIIHKRDVANTSDEDEVVLANYFPNFSIEEFYYQKSQIGSSNIFYSIVRKDIVNEFVRAFEEKGVFIIKVSLGPFVLNSIRNFLGDSQNVLVSDYKLLYDDSQIASIDYNTNDVRGSYLIGDGYVDDKYVLAYSSIVDFFVDDSRAYISVHVDSAENFIYRTYTKYFLYASLFFALLILLVNTAVYLGYRNESGEVYQDYILKKAKVIELDSLSREVQRKRDYLTKNNFLEPSKATFYVDRLSGLKPKGISFDEVKVFPLMAGSGGKDEEFHFDSSLIVVSGEANSAYLLNVWLEEIKKERWVSFASLNKIKQVEFPDLTYYTIEIKVKL